MVLMAGMFAPRFWFPGRPVALAVGAGLALTQRDQHDSGKIMQGDRLYGIMGATSFIGTFRLFPTAGLTTIIGMVFNIMASILGAMPYIGILLFIGVAAWAHLQLL
jgi:hypothetical protein